MNFIKKKKKNVMRLSILSQKIRNWYIFERHPVYIDAKQ